MQLYLFETNFNVRSTDNMLVDTEAVAVAAAYSSNLNSIELRYIFECTLTTCNSKLKTVSIETFVALFTHALTCIGSFLSIYRVASCWF